MMTKARLAILLVAVAVSGACGYWFLVRPSRSSAIPTSISDEDRLAAADGVPGWRSPAGYVGSLACRECHPHEYQTYLETSHSRAMSEVVPDREPPDGVFDHSRSGRRYRVTRRDGRLMHEESLLLDGGGENGGDEMSLSSYAVKYAVGSGHFGKTYLCEAGGFLVESPVTWYSSRVTWGMSPGYDTPLNQSFTRVVPENCLLCHVGSVETSTVSDLKMRVVEESIGCERCHGPGRTHVERQTAGSKAGEPDDSIVNPQRLSRKLSEAVCQQCHLQGDIPVLGRGVRSDDYRPGLPLEQFRCEFRMKKPGSGIPAVGHFEQMMQSDCYRQSETLTCVTCHDPHAPLPPAERPLHYRSVCMTCHQDRGCQVPLETRQEKSDNNCVKCHMPSSQSEVPHVAFTHHRIGMHPPRGAQPAASANEPLVPLSDLSVLSDSDRRRTLLLARLALLQRAGPGLLSSVAGQELARQVDETSRRLPVEAADAAVEVSRAEFDFARGRMLAAAQAAERALAFEKIGTAEAVRALIVLGTLAHQQGRFAEARRWFFNLSQLRRNAADMYFLGLCEEKCGNLEAALTALESARQIEPADIFTYEALAMIRHSRREFDEERRLRAIVELLKRRSAQSEH